MNSKANVALLPLLSAAALVLSSCSSHNTETPVPQPNLRIRVITFDPPDPDTTHTVTANVVLHNTGAIDAAATDTRVSVDGTVRCQAIATPEVRQGDSTIVSCLLGRLQPGSHQVQACADVAGTVGESAETDNCLAANLTVVPGEVTIPEIPEIPLPDSIAFAPPGNADALMAEARVNTQLGLARRFADIGRAYLVPLGHARWSAQQDGCFSWNGSDQAGCTENYIVCPAGGGYQWTLTLNGVCGGTEYRNWVAMRGSTDSAALTGTLRFYQANDTMAVQSLHWSEAADHASGEWTSYQGNINPDQVVATVRWVEAVGAIDINFEMPEVIQVVTHLDVGRTSGRMTRYIWQAPPPPGTWVTDEQITWNGIHGSDTTYTGGQQVTSW